MKIILGALLCCLCLDETSALCYQLVSEQAGHLIEFCYQNLESRGIDALQYRMSPINVGQAAQ
jgi:hypothetical protein